MMLGVIADDFTGASDIANALARGLSGDGGFAAALFLGAQRDAAPADVEAGVVALKSRSAPARDAVAQSLAALAWLQDQGCAQFVYKYCSTFDSTPAGNIGPVAEALADALGVKGVVVCPAFPRAGRTLFQGHLFVGDRLLNESGMERHPINPMADADIRRWLARQTRATPGLAPLAAVRAGPHALREALSTAAAAGETLVVVDAIEDSDLVAIARACRDATLLTGGSGIAIGLADNFLDRRRAAPTTPAVSGPEAILSGSCSATTRAQVALHAATHPTLAVDVGAAMAGRTTSADLAAFVRAHAGAAPLVYSSGAPDDVAAAQKRHGAEAVSATLDALFAATARALIDGGLRRLVVAGGETSGAIVSALDLGVLRIGPEIDPGVPVLTSGGPRPIALALKSGNFGAPDFFVKALALMGDAA